MIVECGFCGHEVTISRWMLGDVRWFVDGKFECFVCNGVRINRQWDEMTDEERAAASMENDAFFGDPR